MNSEHIKKDLRSYATSERKKKNAWFFKTGPGEYGAHDRFLGIANPQVRLVAKKYRDLDLIQLQKLIISPYNEERLCALVILIAQYRSKSCTAVTQEDIYQFYIKNIAFINNWNLVDLSAPHIVGEYLVTHASERKILHTLVRSSIQWERRIGILATWAFIKRNDLDLTLLYAQKLLSDPEDLMHKAVGWMLREVWKKDPTVCENFLRMHYGVLSRTTLRYAIEKMEEKKRKEFLMGNF